MGNPAKTQDKPRDLSTTHRGKSICVPGGKQQLAIEFDRRKRARSDLLSFVEYTYPNWVSGDHHRVICDALHRIEKGELKRLMLFMPPRHSKTEIVTRRFPAWLLGHHPDWQIICSSHTTDFARDTGADVLGVMEDELYGNVFPDVKLREDAKAAGRWRTTAGGIYIAAGVGSTITGRGAHVAIIDDPVKGRNEAESPRMREVAWRWYLGDLYQRLMPGGAIIVVMTRWHEDDLAARALKSDDWEVIEMPAIENEHSENEIALWPEQWPLDVLREKRSVFAKGSRLREWRAQYQQKPTADEGTYIQRAWYNERYDTLPERAHKYLWSDFAVTEAREGSDPDFTEHGVFALPPDDILRPIDWYSGQVTADVWIEEALDLIKKHEPLCWFAEAGVIRRALEPLIRKRMKERKIYCRIEFIPSVKDKAIRGRAFQARSAMGKVRFGRQEWAEEIIEQCVGFPGVRYDDKFDVMAGMCGVIDQAHPAIARSDDTVQPQSAYSTRRRKTPIRENWRLL